MGFRTTVFWVGYRSVHTMHLMSDVLDESVSHDIPVPAQTEYPQYRITPEIVAPEEFCDLGDMVAGNIRHCHWSRHLPGAVKIARNWRVCSP